METAELPDDGIVIVATEDVPAGLMQCLRDAVAISPDIVVVRACDELPVSLSRLVAQRLRLQEIAPAVVGEVTPTALERERPARKAWQTCYGPRRHR